MSPFAYRASDELATALRECKQRFREHRSVVDEWDEAHPERTIVWFGGSGMTPDQWPGGFKDGTEDVPPGLSRAKSRPWLIATRTKAGEPWRKVLARMTPPSIEKVLRRFGVPPSAYGPETSSGMYVAATRWLDGGDRGVFVVNQYELGRGTFGGSGEGIGEHLTPARLSEFYAVKEALEAEKVGTS